MGKEYRQTVKAPRIPKGTTIEQAAEALSAAQQVLVRHALEEQSKEAPPAPPAPPPPPTAFKMAIEAALDGGVHVAILAHKLGLSRARIYQIKEELDAARAAGRKQ